MKKQALLLSLILGTSTFTLTAQATKQVCDWPALKKLSSGNLVSTYTFDYWKFAAKNLKDFKNQDLLEDGAIVGDFHFNNVGIYFDNETKAPELAVIDLDDAGVGSYLADYLKFLTYLKTIDKDIDQKDLLKSYIAGLSSKSYKDNDANAPGKIADLFKKNKSWFDDKNKQAVLKKLNGKQTHFGKNEDLKPVSSLSSDIVSMVDKLKPQMDVLDTGFKMNESGSSIGSLRVLALVREGNKDLNIYEFKELRCPGTEKYKEQQDQADRFASVKKALDSEEFWGKSFIATALDQSGKVEKYFILRKKQENALQDLEIDHMKKKDLEKYANYYAFVLGNIHGRNASANYKNAIKDDADKVLKKADKYSDDYLAHLKEDTKK